jgi:hypothetical protein
LAVYDGCRFLGEVEDHGRGNVQAFLGAGDDRQPLGKFPTRRDAMRAVSSAAKAAEAAS